MKGRDGTSFWCPSFEIEAIVVEERATGVGTLTQACDWNAVCEWVIIVTSTPFDTGFGRHSQSSISLIVSVWGLFNGEILHWKLV